MVVHPVHIYAEDTEADGVHTCRRCGGMVVWGQTNRGKRARFDFPSAPEGYVNHHVNCGRDPAKERSVLLEAPAHCEACHISMARGSTLCADHWRLFREWMRAEAPDGWIIWRLGDKEDRRSLLRHWRRHVLAEVKAGV